MALELIIVTPRGELFAGPAERVVLPGAAGELGVLESHEPLVTALVDGRLEILRSDGTTLRISVSDGFARVAEDRILVLVREGVVEDDPFAAGPGSPSRSPTSEQPG